MSAGTFDLSYDQVDRLQNAIKEYHDNAEKKITNYLHGQGYERLSGSIQRLIPVSDRRKRHARDADALMDRDTDSNLSVTIGTRNSYNYLYFPDDGSNTLHHIGNQQFFFQGVQQEEERVMNEMVGILKFPE